MADKKAQIEAMMTAANIDELSAVMATLNEEGRKIILDGISSKLSDAKKKQLMSAIRDKVAIADNATRNWIVQGVGASYVMGLNHTDAVLAKFGMTSDLGEIKIEILKTAPSLKPHLEAVNALISDAYLNFGNAMSGYIKGSERILNQAVKKQIRSQIAEGRLTGQGVAEVKRTIKSTLADQGFTVLIDRGGNQWELSQYSEMLARTHLLRANNDAAMNRALDYEVDIVEFSSHATTCPICAPLEGQCFSISGNSSVYDPLSGNEPPDDTHPNCEHTLMLRPDLTEK